MLRTRPQLHRICSSRFRMILPVVGILNLFLFVSYDLALHFTQNPSIFGSAIHRFKTFKNGSLSLFPTKPASLSADCCFGTFMQLFKGHDVGNENVFFLEPNPPIPVSAVRSPCRQFLFPKPVNASRLTELVRCYLSSNFVTYKTIGEIRRALRIVKNIFDDNKVPLILCGGSLIGSHRYHGMIPYDDDFDFYIPADKRSFIMQQLTNLCKRDASFLCLFEAPPRLMLFVVIRNGTKMYRIASIDFFPYSTKNASVENTPESAMFPLMRRPLEGELYDSINNYPHYFRAVYGASLHMCKSFGHNFRERVRGCQPTNCDDLNTFLPFVVVSETSVGRLEIGVNASHVRSLFFHRKSFGVFL